MLAHYLAIAAGGASGALARVLLSKALPENLLGIPFQILFINVLGCFVMGALAQIMALHWPAPDHMRTFLMPGFLGGFTTFSAFALEFGLLQDKGLTLQSVIYVCLSVGLSLLFFMLGLRCLRFFS
jgi:fluoride exporter